MRKILILLTTLIMLSACSPNHDSDIKTVSVSFYPLEYFSSRIGGDKIAVFNVLGQGMNAHDYEPSTQDRVKIEESDLFIHNGFDLEHWVEKTILTLSKTEILDASTGIEPLIHDGHPDPHVWLDPYTARYQAANIFEAIVKIDEGNRSYYEANYQALEADLIKLQEEYDAFLKTQTDVSIVLEHEIFSYLESRFHFNQHSISGFLPESEPSIQQLERIIQIVEDEKITHLLLSKYSSKKVAEVLKQETGIQIAYIDPLEVKPNDLDYMDVMKANLVSLKEVMQNVEGD